MTYQLITPPVPAVLINKDFTSWNFQSTVPMAAALPAPVTKGKKKIKEVVYPIFSYYSSLVGDPFWVDIFTQASYGKMPKKFSFNEMTLCYNKGQKEGTQALYQTPGSAYEAVQFIRTYGTIYSPTDQQNAMYQHQTNQMTAQPLTWSTANRKTKIGLVSNYVDELSQAMELSAYETKQLTETVNWGIMTKVFNRDNIGVYQYKITVIQGLCWDAGTRTFYHDHSLKPLRTTSKASTKSKVTVAVKNKGLVPTFRSNWNKLLIGQMNGKQLSNAQQHAYNMNISMNGSSLSYNSDDEGQESDSG